MFWHLRALAFVLVSAVVSLPSATNGADMFMPDWTFTEVLNKYDAAVIARRGSSENTDEEDQNDSKTAQFVVIDLLEGEESLVGKNVVARTLPGETDCELFLLIGKRNKSSNELHWRVAKSVTQAYRQHLLTVSKLEKTGAQRLAFFQPLLEHADESVAANAHLEFVVAAEEAFSAACDQLDRAKIRKWLSEPDVSADRQRLYFAMLAQCGNESDGDWLQAVVEANKTPSLRNIQIGFFLALKGEAGLPLVNRMYLENPNASISEVYAAISALRFVRDLPNSPLSKASLISSFRLVLGNIRMADFVILDLIQLEDWESLDR